MKKTLQSEQSSLFAHAMAFFGNRTDHVPEGASEHVLDRAERMHLMNTPFEMQYPFVDFSRNYFIEKGPYFIDKIARLEDDNGFEIIGRDLVGRELSCFLSDNGEWALGKGQADTAQISPDNTRSYMQKAVYQACGMIFEHFGIELSDTIKRKIPGPARPIEDYYSSHGL